jgi:hypothetical protein
MHNPFGMGRSQCIGDFPATEQGLFYPPIGYSSRGLSIITGILNPFEYFDRTGKR